MTTNNYIRIRRDHDTNVFFFDDANKESVLAAQQKATRFAMSLHPAGRRLSYSVYRRTPLLPYLEIGEPTAAPLKIAAVA